MSDITSSGVPLKGKSAAAGSTDVTARGDVDLLHSKAVGLIGVLFLTLTGSAPITAMLLNVPIVVGNGNGIGSPAAFLVATVILLVFSVGYAAMSSKVTAVGGFYSFISHGLGRELGMAMGFGSVVAYAVFEPSLCGGFAYFMNLKISALFNVNVPWPVLSLAMVAVIAVLTYFDIKVSSAVLGVALVAEVIILIIFDGGVFAHNGNGAVVQAAALNPVAAFQGFPAHDKLAAGAAGIGLFFAFWSWVGFEMAPNYAEESKDPKRIVPLSLYISVLFLGVLYTITCWASQSAFPNIDGAINEAQNSSATYFFDSASRLVGPWVSSLMSYLILTGSFACGMAFHNTTSRYLYSLGREKIIPAAFGKTHKHYKTPYNASFMQTGISVAVILLFWIFAGGNNPSVQAYGMLYGLMALLGTIIILSAQAIVSVAIVVYFRREHPQDVHWWKTTLAPILAFIAQVYIVYLSIANMGFLGGGFAFANYIAWIDLGVVLFGLGYAFYLKTSNPEKFDKIGRLVYQGVPDPGIIGHSET
jgi:amino acid transporter